MLTAAEIGLPEPTLVPTSSFFSSGFGSGFYFGGNSAAMVAIAEDALVISFRGTNDTSAVIGNFDVSDWTDKDRHYELLQPLVEAVDAFVSTYDISTVYVTGHSLGGAMVNAYMNSHPNTSNVKYQGVTFADPGYSIRDVDDNWRIVNFHTDNDIINIPDILFATPGDDNTLIDGIDNGLVPNPFDYFSSTSHSMAPYLFPLFRLHCRKRSQIKELKRETDEREKAPHPIVSARLF